MKGCAEPVEAAPTPRHRHPGDLEPADSGGIECAVSNAARPRKYTGRTRSFHCRQRISRELCWVNSPQKSA